MASTAATVGNVEAIAIDQGASLQGWQISLSGGGAVRWLKTELAPSPP
jgi:hypothetical protein